MSLKENITFLTHPLVILLIFFAHCSTASDAHTPIEEKMSAEQKELTGLTKLTKSELQHLNQWLANEANIENSDLENIAAQPQNTITPESAAAVYEKAKSALNRPRVLTISGEFRGWSGKTIFRMTNGEVWLQRTKGRYTENLDSPEVKISKNKLGFFTLEVIETGKKVGIKKLKK